MLPSTAQRAARRAGSPQLTPSATCVHGAMEEWPAPVSHTHPGQSFTSSPERTEPGPHSKRHWHKHRTTFAPLAARHTVFTAPTRLAEAATCPHRTHHQQCAACVRNDGKAVGNGVAAEEETGEREKGVSKVQVLHVLCAHECEAGGWHTQMRTRTHASAH